MDPEGARLTNRSLDGQSFVSEVLHEADYRRTLTEIETLMDAARNTPEGDRLDVLVALVEAYERKHYPLDLPDPVEAIKFRMEQMGLPPKDLESDDRPAQPRLRGVEPEAPVDDEDGLASPPRARHTGRKSDPATGGLQGGVKGRPSQASAGTTCT
jgi:hypothetical protein